MKQFSIVRLLTSIMFCFLSGSVFGPMVGLEADTAGLAMVAAGGVMSFLPMPQGVAMAGLAQEVWASALLEKFFPKGLWLSMAMDMSEFVNFNKINLAEIGVTPEVYLNQTTTIGTVDASDSPSELILNIYDSQNTKLDRPAIQIERNYNQVAAYTKRHADAIRTYFLKHAAFNFAPAGNSASTPVLAATGADRGDGKRALTIKDVIALQTAFNLAEIPQQDRVLVLDSQHQADLLNADKDLYKAFADVNTGEVSQLLYGFKVFVGTSELPKYTSVSAKVAFGAVVPGGAGQTSIAFQAGEVMRCQGDVGMFHLEASMNTGDRKDVIGFNMRGLATRMRNFGVGALVSLPV